MRLWHEINYLNLNCKAARMLQENLNRRSFLVYLLEKQAVIANLCNYLTRIMKRLYVIIGILILLTGCQKTKENIAEDLVIKAMTDGQWKVSNFVNNGTNITADFTNYKFQYYANRTVDAINNGTVEKTGTWNGDATNMTTYANFVSPAYPLNLINGTWHIDRNSWTYVEATQTIGSETKTMRLDKL